MIRSLWIARTGLDAQQTQLDVLSNNLANVSTNGFKRARAVFEDLLYQNIRQPGAQTSQQTQVPTGLQIGTGARPVATARILSNIWARLRGSRRCITSISGRSTRSATRSRRIWFSRRMPISPR